MIEYARDLVHTFFAVFTFPGNVLLSFVSAENLGTTQFMWTSLGLSLVYWLVVLLVLFRLRAWLRLVGVMLGRIFGDFAFRIGMHCHNLKRAFAKPINWLRQRRQSAGVESETIEFDELDMAVLKLAVKQPNGRVISAIELSEHLPVRPSQLQESLKRLRAFRLLDPAMGTTEGYENYRLTPAGVRFVEQIG